MPDSPDPRGHRELRAPVDAGGTETVTLMLEVAEQGLRLAVLAMPLWLRLEYHGRR